MADVRRISPPEDAKYDVVMLASDALCSTSRLGGTAGVEPEGAGTVVLLYIMYRDNAVTFPIRISAPSKPHKSFRMAIAALTSYGALTVRLLITNVPPATATPSRTIPAPLRAETTAPGGRPNGNVSVMSSAANGVNAATDGLPLNTDAMFDITTVAPRGIVPRTRMPESDAVMLPT